MGLYRALLSGEVVVIGVAAERPGGLAKRLADFRRKSRSASDHHVGRLIREHLDSLQLEVLVAGSDFRASAVAAELKPLMVELHKPAWNVPTALIRSR